MCVQWDRLVRKDFSRLRVTSSKRLTELIKTLRRRSASLNLIESTSNGFEGWAWLLDKAMRVKSTEKQESALFNQRKSRICCSEIVWHWESQSCCFSIPKIEGSPFSFSNVQFFGTSRKSVIHRGAPFLSSSSTTNSLGLLTKLYWFYEIKCFNLATKEFFTISL